MYDDRTRQAAVERLATESLSVASRATGISRSTLRAWRDHPRSPARATCPRCHGVHLPFASYAALLGYYLGDGCVSAHSRYFSLRVSCDATYPDIIDDVTSVISAVHTSRPVHLVDAPGVVVVCSAWKHWPCLFPQHGPGRKHERPIMLEDWQRAIVEAHPAAFLRGLFHSDGSRVRNWTARVVAGERKRYDYPRWQFTNESTDIRELCCWALDLVEVAWRQSNRKTISVSTRAGVARLDELIGLKT